MKNCSTNRRSFLPFVSCLKEKKHMNLFTKYLVFYAVLLLTFSCTNQESSPRKTDEFNEGWKFIPGDGKGRESFDFDDSKWRELRLPHDWSIEGEFSKDHPAGVGGGALPGGIGWYRKTFKLSSENKGKMVFIDFDGVYMNSEVWINGKYLGKRPFGYISFRHDLTAFLNFGDSANVIAVKVDNSQQPNSRWYSGSGIYGNVWMVKTGKVYVEKSGTYVTTPKVDHTSASVSLKTSLRNAGASDVPVKLQTSILDPEGKVVSEIETESSIIKNAGRELGQEFIVADPQLWSLENPKLYKAVTKVVANGEVTDQYETIFGIRYFSFDADKGFSLNGISTKIKGVCNHHDLGCLGSAVNTRALERRLEILKDMGCNGIRTSHNPPAPELLELCDKMGFIVMDETFDMWKKKKSDFDYSMYWDEWHKRDLSDHIKRDRNHPSVFVWSIGNEIPEQWGDDTSGRVIARELAAIVRELDKTRPITSATNDVNTYNHIIKSGALDLLGYNYNHDKFKDFHKTYPGRKLIITESTSALATRGSYDMPSDTIRRWPVRWDLPFTGGNKDNSCSAYDNCSAPWGSTHEETWKVVKKYDHISGMYIWTGFDYLGEPTPYVWPSRSSYFGIMDLCGFPKDVFYMYQSEWTDKPMLHIFPHWNWKPGEVVDVWAYYNNADEAELFLNGKSLGIKKKAGEDLHVFWRIPFQAGELKAVSRKNGKEVLTKAISTAGAPAKIILEADRNEIKADGKDLSFITVKVVDKDGRLVPYADNMVKFSLEGKGKIAGVDNGSQTSTEPFKANYRKAFHGLCQALIQSSGGEGSVILTAASDGLEPAKVKILVK
jgi:beta-galactosidase